MEDQFKNFIYRRVKTLKELEVEEIVAIFSEIKFKKGKIFKERDTIIKRLGFPVVL